MRPRWIIPLSACLLLVAACSTRSAITPPGQLDASGRTLPHIIQRGQEPIFWESFNPITPNAFFFGIAAGPDRNIWVTEFHINGIARVKMNGTVSEFPLPISQPLAVTTGADKFLYVTSQGTPAIAKVATSGSSTYQTLPSGSDPRGVTAGPDGNVWFTANLIGSEVGKITPTGTITEYPLPFFIDAEGITSGPDGNVWFVGKQGGLNGSGMVGNVSPASGTITEYPLSGSPLCNATSIAKGKDGNLWVACEFGPIAKVTPSGAVTYYAADSTGSLNGIVLGPNGKIWFATSGMLGTISETGKVLTYTPPGGPNENQPLNLVTGSDGNLWYTDQTKDVVGVYIYHVLDVSPSSIAFGGINQSQVLSVSESSYSGTWTAKSSATSVATVIAQGASNEFIVTSVGSGSCTITIADKIKNTFPVAVSVP